MATLNQLADYIAGSLKQPLNEELKRRIKFSIKAWRAILIRQDIERHGLSGIYTQRLVVDLVKVDSVDNCKVQTGCQVLRTQNKVPKPIRRSDDVDFPYVGEADWSEGFTEGSASDMKFLAHLKYTKQKRRYEYVNGYIYVYNAKRMKFLGLVFPFENPEQAITYCSNSTGSDCYNDDMEFPMPLDMLNTIIKGMLEGEYQIFNDDDLTVKEQVNAEPSRSTNKQ
jgi:hypothetical protein